MVRSAQGQDRGTVDFGSGYDCFVPVANVGNGEVGRLVSENRGLLRDLIEGWRFELRNAPIGSERDFEVLPVSMRASNLEWQAGAWFISLPL
jgi:hypothetical protein